MATMGRLRLLLGTEMLLQRVLRMKVKMSRKSKWRLMTMKKKRRKMGLRVRLQNHRVM